MSGMPMDQIAGTARAKTIAAAIPSKAARHADRWMKAPMIANVPAAAIQSATNTKRPPGGVSPCCAIAAMYGPSTANDVRRACVSGAFHGLTDAGTQPVGEIKPGTNAAGDAVAADRELPAAHHRRGSLSDLPFGAVELGVVVAWATNGTGAAYHEAVATAAPILVEIFKHHRWANERLVEACASLGSDELDQTSPGTYGSIRDTIVHLLAAEERFLELLGERLDGASLREHEQSPDLDELRRRAKRSGERLALVAQRASGATLARGEWRGEPYAIPVSILLAQALNHASEHRAQVATVLGAHGITPPALDAWSYGPPELWKFR